jgi:hypothetical protein
MAPHLNPGRLYPGEPASAQAAVSADGQRREDHGQGERPGDRLESRREHGAVQAGDRGRRSRGGDPPDRSSGSSRPKLTASPGLASGDPPARHCLMLIGHDVAGHDGAAAGEHTGNRRRGDHRLCLPALRCLQRGFGQRILQAETCALGAASPRSPSATRLRKYAHAAVMQLRRRHLRPPHQHRWLLGQRTDLTTKHARRGMRPARQTSQSVR